MSSFKLRLHKRIDVSIPTVGIILSLFGLVMVLSASQIIAANNFGNQYYFFIRQLIFWLIGLAGFFYFLRLPLDRLYAARSRYLIATLVLLVLVLVIGPKIAGVHRWINLGFFQFQPSEFAKLFLVIYLAGWFAAKGDKIKSFTQGLLPFLGILAAIGGLVILEKDMGTMLILVALALTIFFVARASWWQFGGVLAVIGVAIVGLILIAPYRAARLTTFLHQNNQSTDTLGGAYHTQQAVIAIGSGGPWGVGFGQGISKYAYLPQAYTDSIFAVIAEELGFVRASLVIVAFVFLAWRGYLLAGRANSQFVQLVAVGVATVIIVQALINIGGMLGAIPLTGVPLPFVSYGGSSLVVSMAMLGLLTNCSRETTD
ncbi:MAG TPA: putative lipid II flippase FtsW [Candidatus Saccharimonadales bacterium]|nr:putative lipid II flippase FtsW [Candidatus Saccharimonadales bacterium]